MSKIILAAGLAVASLSAPAFAQDTAATTVSDPGAEAERLALAREILDLGLPKGQREEMFFSSSRAMAKQMTDAQIARYNLTDKGALAILDAWIETLLSDSKVILEKHIPAIMEGWAHGLAKKFTRSELEDLKAFVATPTGAKFFARQSEIISDPDFAAANQAYLRDILAQGPAAQARLVRELTEYMRQSKGN